MKNIVVYLIVMLMCCNTATYSKNKDTKKQTQQKGIGLVLSGGGAKGLYHIGIIKALEENDIPIDYVAGASMGAIVAGMYAAGWSPEKMWEFFKTDSVAQWLSGKIPQKYHGYYAQFRPTAEMVGINIKTDTTINKNIIKIPTNLIPPYMIDIAFNKMLAPASYAAQNNFDSLMVPFRCVATDTYQKELIVFRNGQLPIAIRTSMTIPLIFKPLKINQSLLYDGGILNNFPYQILIEEFNPEHIIGGICTDNIEQPSSDNLTNQIMSIATRKTDYQLPDNNQKNITIKRVMPEIGILDYHKADSVIKKGYYDAMEMMPEIKNKIKNRRTKIEIQKIRKQFNQKIPELTFDSIIITGLTEQQKKYVQRQLGVNKQKYFTYEYFYQRYMKLIAAGVFNVEFPEMKYNPKTGFYRIHLRMTTKASMRFSLGGNISSSSLNQGYIAFRLKHTTNVASTYGLEGDFGMFLNGFKITGSHNIHTNRPYYFDYSAKINGMDYNGGNMQNYYKDVNWRFLYQQNIDVETAVAIPIFKTSAFRTKITAGNNLYKYYENLYTSADTASYSTFNHIAINPMIETNSLNYNLYGNSGTMQKFSLKYTLGLENYTPGSISIKTPTNRIQRWWIEAKYSREQYVNINKWLTIGYNVDVTLSNHPDFENNLISSITAPRFSPIPQTNTMFMTEFTANSYAAGGIIPVVNILKNKQLYLKTYFFTFIPDRLLMMNRADYTGSLDVMNVIQFIYGGTLVYQTAIGPASLSLNKFTTGPNNWSLQFNFGYMLFKNN